MQLTEFNGIATPIPMTPGRLGVLRGWNPHTAKHIRQLEICGGGGGGRRGGGGWGIAGGG